MKKVDLGFTDPPLNENLSDLDKQVKKILNEFNGLTPAERMLVLLICGIGDRVDRLINMVRMLSEKCKS